MITAKKEAEAAESTVQVFVAEWTEETQESRLFYRFVKRAMDIVLSLAAIISLSLVFAVIAVAVRLDSKGPAFFHHKRIGKDGKPFVLHKFRTMVRDADKIPFTAEQQAEFATNYKLSNDPRITKLGSFLRKSSLDELPQLFNILRGDLSIVGPRPVVEDELEYYGVHKYRFLSAKPGLTGYWQVNGRSRTTYEERVNLELFYVENASLGLDVKIIFKTVPVVLNKVGAV
ncbi:MAG: sugar transferase [Defluviitaleaceae bacterium]|nr:sugar transferase [Defluviitaleaceae bacterium]